MPEIDYLFEDPPVSGQNFALVSIVGPNLQQKCDVYGLKIRGVADSMDRARTMSQKLTKIDPDFDIYTVEVGKFFPLDVNPMELQNVEYQNTQLNELVKNYLENRENANVEYEKRKNDMIKKAIAEGKSKKDQENEEHPIAILNRIEEITEKMNQAKQHLEDLSSALSYNKGEYDKFTLDMRESAELEFSKLKISANEGSSSSSSSAGASSSATGSSLPTISELPDLNAQADPQTWSSKVIN
jgi:F0F1-type ATP synthase membrane subunit b/b'